MCQRFGTLFSIFKGGVKTGIILPAYTTYEDGTDCSETSAHKIQMSENHPKEIIQHSEQDKV
jgi:hypothetical protein